MVANGARSSSALLLLLALNACGTTPIYNPVGCIYDAKTDQRAMVFNFRTHWMSFQDKRSANVNSSSEFGGYFHDCSDSSYYCISGPVSIVIPVRIQSLAWKHNGTSCKAKLRASTDSYSIACQNSYGRMTRVDYSPRQGVSSIRQVDKRDNTNFVLRGDCGIFCERRRAKKAD